MTDATSGKASLRFVWGLRCKLRAEGNKLWAEGDKLRAEGNKLWAEGNKLWAEGDKLRAEGNKLWAEGVLEAHGNITLSWEWVPAKNDNRCTLSTGEVFEP